MVKLDLGVERVEDEAAANEVTHRMSVQKVTHKTLANEVTAHEAAAQMSDAYVDDSSVLDQAEGITDVVDSSTPDEDDRTEQTDVQNSYKKYLCSSKMSCYDDPFTLDYYDDPSPGSNYSSPSLSIISS